MNKKFPNLIKAGLKVGDTVDGIYGEMVVTGITNGPTYSIRAETKQGCFVTFTEHGRVNAHDTYPSIWFKSDTDWFKPPMSPPEPDHVKEFHTDRPVWVRDSYDKKWNAKYAALYLSINTHKFVTFNGRKRQANATGITGWRHVSYTKPEGAEDHEGTTLEESK